jgi:hypothetical protein
MVALALSDLEDQGLHVGTDGTRLLVGPRQKLTADVIELVKVNRSWLLALALGRVIVRARPNSWMDPQPDICSTCETAAIGYSPSIAKACSEHLNGGQRW